MKKLAVTLFAAVAGLSLLFIACSKDNSNGDNGNTEPNVVRMNTGMFTPETLQVKTGTTVTWINDSDDTHTVFAAEEMDSGDIPAGGTYSHRFGTAGTYNYQCTIHRGATGVVIVSN